MKGTIRKRTKLLLVERELAENVRNGWTIKLAGRDWRKITDARYPLHSRDTMITIVTGYSSSTVERDSVVLVRKYRDVLQRQIGRPRVVYDYDGQEDYRTITFRWRCIRGATKAEVYMLANGMYHTYCQHEHDCCGNVYYDVWDVLQVSGREWIIKVRGGRNV